MQTIDGVEISVGMKVYTINYNLNKRFIGYILEEHIVKSLASEKHVEYLKESIYSRYTGARYSCLYARKPIIPDPLNQSFKTWLTLIEIYREQAF